MGPLTWAPPHIGSSVCELEETLVYQTLFEIHLKTSGLKHSLDLSRYNLYLSEVLSCVCGQTFVDY